MTTIQKLALLLALTACSTAPTVDACRSRADFAAQVAKDKRAGYPQPYAEQHYLAQVAGDAEHSTTVRSIIRAVYQRDATPAAIYQACKQN